MALPAKKVSGAPTADPSLRQRYCLYGDFPGDDHLENRIRLFEEDCSDPNKVQETFQRLVNLANDIPPKGGRALADCISSQQQISVRDSILSMLLEYYLESPLLESPEAERQVSGDISIDDDFIWIACNSNSAKPKSELSRPRVANPSRYPQFKVFLAILPFASSKVAASVCRQFLESASTKFRQSVILLMEGNPEVSNEELLDIFKTSTSSFQRKLLKKLCSNARKKCRDKMKRVQVLETILNQNLISDPEKFFYYASSDYIQKKLAMNPKLSLQKWQFHREVYVSELRRRLEACRNADNSAHDRIKCGKVWNEFMAQTVLHPEKEDAVLLLNLLEKYVPCLIQACAKNIRLHLEEVSAGKEDILDFDYVERISLPGKLVYALPKLLRKQKALDAIQSDDFKKFKYWMGTLGEATIVDMMKDHISSSNDEDLWESILGDQMGQKVFKYFNDFLFERMEVSSLSNALGADIRAIDCWAELHDRSRPDQLSPRIKKYVQDKQTTEEMAWTKWYESYNIFSENSYVSIVSDALLEACKTVRPLDFSRVTMCARALRFFLEYTLHGFQTARGKVPEHLLLHSLWSCIDRVYGNLPQFGSPPRRIVELNQTIESVVDKILGLLLNFLSFDPRDSAKYVNRYKVTEFSEKLASVIGRSTSKGLLEDAYKVAADCLSRATRNDMHIPPSNGERHYCQVADEKTGKRHFVYFDSSTHVQAIEKSIYCMMALMTHSKSPIVLQKKIWNTLKSSNAVAVLDSDMQFIQYCCKLPEEIRKMEEKEITSRACRELHKEPSFNSSWMKQLADCGLLLQVLNKCDGLSTAYRRSILEYNGTFDLAPVRDILREQTNKRGGDERAQAYSTLLRRAIPSSFQVQALEYIVSKIKNEASPYKATVYLTLISHVGRMVTDTFKGEDKETAEALSAAFISIVKNDLARRDSNGSSYFRRISEDMMSKALGFDPLKKLKDIRKVWIHCSLHIKWQVERIKGDILQFSFPLASSCLPVTTWINEEEWDQAFPHKEFPHELAVVRRHVDLPRVVKSFDESQVFGPNDAVELLRVCLCLIWDTELHGLPLELVNFDFPADYKGTIFRFKQLFLLTSIHWEDSVLLADLFDTLYGPSMKTLPKEHFLLAEGLLESIFSISTPSGVVPGKTYFFKHPRLAGAVDSVMEYAVEHDIWDVATSWIDRWTENKIYGGPNSWNKGNSRVFCFLLQYNMELPREPKSKDLVQVDLDERLGSYASTALKMTSSAILCDTVWSTIVNNRPDILMQYCKDGAINGVFLKNESSNVLPLLYDKLLSIPDHFSPKLAKSYATYAYALSRDRGKGLNTRVKAIEQFVTCPATKNSEILAALTDESLEEPLVEAITLNIFALDAPWYILAHLLSIEALESRKQSWTASLLAHVSKHIAPSQVVDSLALLLHPSRRGALGILLQKAIVRMLFDTNTKKSKELLLCEWESNDTHTDVRHVILTLCLQSVLEKHMDVAFEWGILEKIAINGTKYEESSLLLLSVLTDQSTIQLLTKRWQVGQLIVLPSEDQSVYDIRYSLKALMQSQTIESLQKRDRFYSLAEKLAQSLPQPDRRVALLGKLRLSRFLADPFATGDDQKSLAEIEDIIMEETGDELIEFWISEISKIYGSGLQNCVKNTARQMPEWKARVMTKELWMKVCVDNSVAQQASRFIKRLLSKSNSGEITAQRRMWIALEGLTDHAGSFLFYLDIFDDSMFDYFEEQQNDARRICKVTASLRGTRSTGQY